MKIEQQPREFQPITITLESKIDAFQLMAVLKTGKEYYTDTSPNRIMAEKIIDALEFSTTT